ncbi:tRNA (adenosine(37)-N6)-dimethylallyltransferase MiaA [Oceanobacillus sojae]|uniref:tRNA (adenosine(37)-N6)-dimethylallyltransferase MiaA n=1 Tax=Oceanobacillus sojae TaxID=582851 RepID=UPI00098839F4|nr:tRNA (adenosine(37)-N6)-dimethylallyltransferase MiaA [Oceanobacillus sojae]MCT1903824.1 tRNA (adenosine(37)-N6)-dimethylallyltransferase MiaA [Oceanobacillus sojae]
MKKKVVSIVGPTAVGKTTLGIAAAKKFQGEIISGDSTQVYMGMDIGTAKVTSEETEGIPHHMIDIIRPDQPFSVADFQEHVKYHIEAVHKRGNLPIIVGGSGLYIQSVLFDYHFSDQRRDAELTNKLFQQIEAEGPEKLYERLKQIDPEQAKKVHPNNHRRLVRALEVYELTGLTMSEYQKEQQAESPYDPFIIGLDMERATLYDRINRRVDQMIEEGLMDEVQSLVAKGYKDCQSMHAIGYKEIVSCLENRLSQTDAIAAVKQNSRKYAKRQLTWFRNKLDVNWYQLTEKEASQQMKLILSDLAGFLE